MSIKSEELDFLRSGINLGLLAKNIVNGFLIGQHKGTRRGIGSEFSQYRSYQSGDDIRQLTGRCMCEAIDTISKKPRPKLQ